MDNNVIQLIGNAVEGASNVFTVSDASVKVTRLVQGGLYRLKFDNINTGAVTVDISSTGATAVVGITTSPVLSGDIRADTYLDFVYTDDELVSVVPFKSDYLQSFETIYIPAKEMTSRTTNGAAAGTVEFATNDIMVTHFAFDPSTEEGVQFSTRFGQDWDLGTVKAKLHWDGAAAAVGTVVWGVRGRSYSNGDAIDQVLGTEITVTDTLLTVGEVHRTSSTTAITLAGTPAINSYIIFQIVAKLAGTISVDQLLMGITIQYGKTRNIIEEF